MAGSSFKFSFLIHLNYSSLLNLLSLQMYYFNYIPIPKPFFDPSIVYILAEQRPPLWFYSVHFGPIWFILSTLVLFCSYGPFGPICSILSTLVQFGPFSLIRSTLILFGLV